MSIVMCNLFSFQGWLLGVENRMEYELLLNAKRSQCLCSAEMDNSRSEDILDQSAMQLISNFFEVSISIYQADQYFFTLLLLVNAVRWACSTGRMLRIFSEPPATASTAGPSWKRYGDSAII